ncbi:MAG: NADH-quinone oxidoreductase subunit NuoH [Chloroflexota bacterium]|nr:NADH-quinone oxidoreductase subunit NuoH [Chloroflexota bacterium]
MLNLPDVVIQATHNVLDTPVDPGWPGNFWAHWAIYAVGIILVVLGVVMGFIWVERRLMGPFQLRMGPNRCGPLGLLQPVADAVKVLLKEDIVAFSIDKIVHLIAPILVFLPVLLIFAVIPFQDGVGLIPDLNVGILFIVAIGSFETIAVFMAGYGSNNKYALISAMRGVAQMLSYEMPMVLSLVAVLLVTQSLSMQEIVHQQTIPFILLFPLSFLIYFTGALAELQRTPFDLLEGESEIVAGYHIEYSGMKFAMFYLGEYGSTFAQAAIVTTVFLSGWQGPFLPPFLWFFIKVFAVFGFIIWIRMTWPRVRIDQLMGFAWKFMLPLSLINILVVAIEVMLWAPLSWWVVPINMGLMVALLGAWSSMFELRGGPSSGS